jgi:hypothetical protein
MGGELGTRARGACCPPSFFFLFFTFGCCWQFKFVLYLLTADARIIMIFLLAAMAISLPSCERGIDSLPPCESGTFVCHSSELYWGTNLLQLLHSKLATKITFVFHYPQSIFPQICVTCIVLQYDVSASRTACQPNAQIGIFGRVNGLVYRM